MVLSAALRYERGWSDGSAGTMTGCERATLMKGNAMKRNLLLVNIALLLSAEVFTHPGAAQEKRFLETVGPGNVGAVTQTAPLQVPYITWGGDMATFYGNGGLETKPGTLFQKQGLNLKLVAGDDFVQQVRDYRAGKTPFLRGTFHMIGLASEVLGSDPRTKGVVILQLTWSAGDHLIARQEIKTVTDLKGKTVALQEGGPHVGMLDDVLKSAKLTWNDVKVVWAKDLTGTPTAPPELLRKRSDIDACFAITPDMIGLCGGLRNVGTGAEGTVKGARVLVSTAEMSRSIADVYVCRKDFYDANKALITKFVAGYLKACEEIIELKKQYEASGSDTYKNLLQLTQSIYGKTTIPVLDDAHGLLSDCTFVGYPGNVTFFTQQGNLHGFEALHKAALDLAVSRGYAKERMGLFPSGLDYQSPAFLSYLSRTQIERTERFRPEVVRSDIEALTTGALDDRTILSFTISFEPNQSTFTAEQYGAEYQRVIETADKFGNAVIVIRGHADPTKTLLDLVRAGLKKGVLQRSGSSGNYSYSLNGKPLDLGATSDLLQLVEQGAFDGVAESSPRETMQAALNLSRTRAEAVMESIAAFSKSKGHTLDTTQVQPVGVGIREPFIAKPANLDQAKQNMRVEFRVVRVPAEATKSSDFDF
jgi:ABC-type nitrate/sulfonate/bicarbonate transport system substrate-binding protein/outer membrane protein OmpA-like peptidoglycan-associated protein